MADEKKDSLYVLREDVRIFFNDDDEIRFRKGVWNYVEAIINLRGQDENIKRFFKLIINKLYEEGEVDVEAIASNDAISKNELQLCILSLEDIKSQGFLYTSKQKGMFLTLTTLLGRSMGMEMFEGGDNVARPVLFVTDTAFAADTAKVIAKQIGLPIDILDENIFIELMKCDLTTKTEAVEYLQNIERFEKFFTQYSCVIGSMISPNISFLRNLNRILIKLEKPLVLGFIDGPFCSILSTVSPQTGCFECYEQRLHARMEDTLVYHRFAEASRKLNKKQISRKDAVFTPFINMLTSAVITEGYLYSCINMLRLAGRVINIYVPMIEIQVQDLLRVPYCPACGHVSMAKMNEMYISSKNIVDDMLDKIEITKPLEKS